MYKNILMYKFRVIQKSILGSSSSFIFRNQYYLKLKMNPHFDIPSRGKFGTAT